MTGPAPDLETLPGYSWKDDRIAALLRFALGAVFVYAGSAKALQIHTFADDIANYHLLPGNFVPIVATTLPYVELAAGGSLLLGVWSRGASLLAASMMAAFTLALLQAFLRGIDLACGCFGGAALADWTTVVRDVVLLAGAIYVSVFDTGRFGLMPRRR